MAPKKYTNRREDTTADGRGEFVGIITVIVSAFLLLIMITGGVILGALSRAVFNFMLGVFGFSIYPILLITLLWGIFKVQKRSLSVPRRYIVVALIVFIMAVMIVHLATSLSYITDKGFTHYMGEVYSNRNTCGGVVFGLFVYGIHALFKTVFSFILYSLVIVCALLFCSEAVRSKLFKIDTKKSKAPRNQNKQRPTQASTVWQEERHGARGGMTAFSPSSGLYVDTIVKTGSTVTESGKFDQLKDHGKKQSVQATTVTENYESDSEKKKRAKEILFAEQNYTDYFMKSPAAAAPVVRSVPKAPEIPVVPFPAPKEFEHNFVPGDIIDGDDLSDVLARELAASGQQPVETQAQTFTPETEPAPAPVNDYYDRPILNGDLYSNPAKKAAAEVQPQTPTPEPALPADYYDRPILNGDRYMNGGQTVAPAPQPNFDDLYTTPAYSEPEPTTRPEPAPVEFEPEVQPGIEIEDFEDEPVEGAIVSGDYYQPEPELTPDYFNEPDDEPLSYTVGDIVNGDSFGDEDFFSEPEIEDEPAQTQPTQPESKTTEGEPSYFNFINDIEDKSEYTYENENDTTGRYHHLDDSAGTEFTGKAEAIDRKLTGKNRVAENQIDIDAYKRSAPVPEPEPVKPKPRKKYKYTPPPVELMVTESSIPEEADEEDSRKRIEILESTFELQGISAEVTNVITGPAVTKYEMTVPPGTSVKRIAGFEPDLSYNLASSGKIRIEAPIPGKRAIGIEVPNQSIGVVGLKDIIDSPEFRNKKSPVTIALGKDIQGNVIVDSMDNMVHMLIAGTTGSGKSVCLNTILISLLYKSSPEDVRLILIDPKMVGFTSYRDLPHMLIPNPIIDAGQALNALKWLRAEMERRYKILQHYAMEKIQEFNGSSYVKEGVEAKLPYIVMVIDEYGDLMISPAVDKRALEDMIMSIASKARAAGIHLILATQRPSRDVVTGTIKANLPSRIACKVASATESRIILDSMGAEALVGRGDMLVAPASSNEETRVQCAYITNSEVKEVIKFIKENNEAEFDSEFEEAIVVKEANKENGDDDGDENEPYDRELIDVVRCVMKSGQASSSLVQRRFRFGWNKAARIMEQMEQLKFISPQNGTKPREVYITPERFEEFFGEPCDE